MDTVRYLTLVYGDGPGKFEWYLFPGDKHPTSHLKCPPYSLNWYLGSTQKLHNR